jgi:hypothetical protein
LYFEPSEGGDDIELAQMLRAMAVKGLVVTSRHTGLAGAARQQSSLS